jgi:arsenate reductase (thioredoxin)
MAHGIAAHLMGNHTISSAGIRPEEKVSPWSVKVMQEIGINISAHKPTLYSKSSLKEADFVLCFGQTAFSECKKKFSHSEILFYDVPDPWGTDGTEEEILQTYRETRNKIFKIVSELKSHIETKQ